MLEALEQIRLFAAIRESAYAYPVLLWVHLLALAIWGGMLLVTDFRFLGFGFGARSVEDVLEGLRWPKRVSFAVIAVSGILLFGAKAGLYASHRWFWIKMAILGLLGLTHLVLRRGSPAFAGAISLVLLVGLIGAGRGPATVKDMMHSVVDPTADFLFESVQIIADEQGVREIAPRTDQEWQEVRSRLETLIRVAGRLSGSDVRAARPRDRSGLPGIENEPARMQAMIESNPADFASRAAALRDAAFGATRAAEAKDKEALLSSLDGIDRACEACHVVYWYPNDPLAVQAARERGIIP